jgi:hypothetical protein
VSFVVCLNWIERYCQDRAEVDISSCHLPPYSKSFHSEYVECSVNKEKLQLSINGCSSFSFPRTEPRSVDWGCACMFRPPKFESTSTGVWIPSNIFFSRNVECSSPLGYISTLPHNLNPIKLLDYYAPTSSPKSLSWWGKVDNSFIL